MSGGEPAEVGGSCFGTVLPVGPWSSGSAISIGSDAKSLDSPFFLCEGAGVAERQYQRAWVSAGLQVRAFPRPDGKWLVKLPEDHPELWSRLIERVRSDLAAPLLINMPADLDAERGGILQAAGFISARTEALWRIPLASMSARPIHSNSHRLLPVDSCDLNRVVDLDNTIRADIPGTRAWRGTLTDLSETLDDPDFDPALYLVAVHAHTGSYDGLIRVWNRRPWPRLGCLGVRVAWRRTRLPAALVSAAARVLRDRGVTDVVTETDVRNGESHPMASSRGTSTGTMTEWERPA